MVNDLLGTAAERRTFAQLHGVSASSRSQNAHQTAKRPATKIDIPQDGSKPDDHPSPSRHRSSASKPQQPRVSKFASGPRFEYANNLHDEPQTARRTGSRSDSLKRANPSRSPLQESSTSSTCLTIALAQGDSHLDKGKAKAHDPAPSPRRKTRSQSQRETEVINLDDSDDDIQPVSSLGPAVPPANSAVISRALQAKKDRQTKAALESSAADPDSFYRRNDQRPAGPVRLEQPHEDERRSARNANHSTPTSHSGPSIQRSPSKIVSRMKGKAPSPNPSPEIPRHLANGSAGHPDTSSRQPVPSAETVHASDLSHSSKRRRTDKLHTSSDPSPDASHFPHGVPLNCIVVADIWRSLSNQATEAVFQRRFLQLRLAGENKLKIDYADIRSVEAISSEVQEHGILSMSLRTGSGSASRLQGPFPTFDPRASGGAAEVCLIAKDEPTNLAHFKKAIDLMKACMAQNEAEPAKFSFLLQAAATTKTQVVKATRQGPWPNRASTSRIEALPVITPQRAARTLITPGERRSSQVDSESSVWSRKKVFDIQPPSPKSEARATVDVDMPDISSTPPRTPELTSPNVSRGKLTTYTGSRVQTRSQGNVAAHEPMLQYPYEGIGAVTLLRSDYDRLYDGQLLNDTVIEFGLKVIFEDIRTSDPELASSIYVFNTFFFKLLDEAAVDVTYRKLRKWTSKVDLFSKKYIVVPINEDYHWYLAIIVNPGLMLAEPSTDDRDRGKEGGSGPEQENVASATMAAPKASASLSPDDAGARLHPGAGALREAEVVRSASSDVETPPLPPLLVPLRAATDAEPTPMDLDPDSRASTPSRNAPASGDVDLNRTLVITFDSLGGGHSKVRNRLFDYLRLEALDKKRISATLLQSLAAKHDAKASSAGKVARRPTRARDHAQPEAHVAGAVGDTAAASLSAASPTARPDEAAARKIQVQDVRPSSEDAAARRADEALSKLLPKPDHFDAHVPKQPNFCDCGIYLLHYFDRFFRHPERLLKVVVEGKSRRQTVSKRGPAVREQHKREDERNVESEWEAGEVSGKRMFWRQKAEELSELWRLHELQKRERAAIKQDRVASDEEADVDVDVSVATRSKSREPEHDARRDAPDAADAATAEVEPARSSAPRSQEPTAPSASAQDGAAANGDVASALGSSSGASDIEQLLLERVNGQDAHESQKLDQILEQATLRGKQAESSEAGDGTAEVEGKTPVYHPFVPPPTEEDAPGSADLARQQSTPTRFGSSMLVQPLDAQLRWPDVSASLARTHSHTSADTDDDSSVDSPVRAVSTPSASSSAAAVEQL